MLFNSFTFWVFFPVVYLLYLSLRRNLSRQNLLLLLAGVVFYGYWDVRFLLLLALSTGIDFAVGELLGRTDDPRRRKALLVTSLATNLGILGFFKYFGFFADGAVRLLDTVGMEADPITLRVLLPVGVSFYTFQALSYTIDVYRRRIEPVHDPLIFATFVSFFPQLVAGPIERAGHMMPQIARHRRVTAEHINSGLLLVTWGYFKKVVIADNLALVANPIFDDSRSYQGLDLVIAALAFSVQIYCDFSGYTDIARGLARLLGFDISLNFRLPYFAKSPSDFWQRWHISLSSWLRDYLYVPLGGNRGGELATMRNLMIVMVLGGLWHGASGNFVLWGAYHGTILIGYRVVERRRWGSWLPGSLRPGLEWLKVGLMFGFTVAGWILFRSNSLDQIVYIFTHLGLSRSPGTGELAQQLIFFSFPLVVADLYQHWTGELSFLERLPVPARGAACGAMVVAILVFGVRGSSEFIYFQF